MSRIVIIGDPILRKKALPVGTIDASVLALITSLKDSVQGKHHALGLAAPQIGVSLAVFVARFPVEGIRELTAPKVFINPHLKDPSPETWLETEGCLSIPHVHAHVRRPVSITVSYQDEQGREHTERFHGWDAKIIMHENDHLNGVLFVDRLSKKDKKSVEPDLRKLTSGRYS